MDIHGYMAQLKEEIDQQLIAVIACPTETPLLVEAMCYSVENGGKRLRPILLLMMLEAFGYHCQKGMHAAVALEMIHTYSLIHDDLPAMDDDDLRRGQPTNHKVYGEAVAILAGDGLLTEAFHVLAKDKGLPVETRLELIQLLSATAGAQKGMITGQALDIQAEGKKVNLMALKHIHELKTGRLIEFACLAAGMIAKQPPEIMSKLSQFAKRLGLAFQIQDDILDVEGDAEKMGKPVGSDASKRKSTYVSLLGLAAAKQMLADEIEAALSLLDDLPIKSDRLKALTHYVAKRAH
ncbi:MAG: polyprenyl synthetase family protein [Defluviitaleaceae bacterium]|nr:polyprenyl synthetase family protein [Defluviitaleaceae bacterium]